MSLEIVRRIRDSLHGTIDVSELEDAVLDHEVVQRLRRIRQLAFLNYVFPGATHSRFEHSLGVMHLAGEAWTKLAANQKRLADTGAKIQDFAAKERANVSSHGFLAPTFLLIDQIFSNPYYLQVLRLAGLLHDVGHPPFSHSGERLLANWDEVYRANQDAPAYILDWIGQKRDAERSKSRGKSSHVRHEVFSLLLIEKVLRETFQRRKGLRIEVDPRDVISIIAPEIQPSAHSPLRSNGVYQMLHELVSGELDIDRMDYLLRDARECGVVYGIFDAARILDSLCIYQDNIDKSLHVAINTSGLAAFDDYLKARQSMYLQVYFHKTAASAEAMMQNLTSKTMCWKIPANAAEFAEIDEYNIETILTQHIENSEGSPVEKIDLKGMLKNLLRHRKLWKRVFEISSKSSDPEAREQTVAVQKLLLSERIVSEHVSSLTSLTRFQPRDGEARSRNYLRLIVRDHIRFPHVVPIEDHANFIHENARHSIQRLYVNPEDWQRASAVILKANIG